MGVSRRPPLVLMLGGSSLTSGRLCNPPYPWTMRLLADMQAHPACKGQVIIINTGKGSQTSDYGASEATLMAPLRPTHVLMEDFGINDCAIGPVSIPQATANFYSMVASYRAANPNVIIAHQTMSPASAGDANRTNLATYYANGTTNATALGIETLENYLGTAIVPGGWVKPLPLNLTVLADNFVTAVTPGYVAPAVGTTWNPADVSANITLSGGNLIATANTAGAYQTGRALNALSGLVHFEATIGATSINGGQKMPGLGIADGSAFYSLSRT